MKYGILTTEGIAREDHLTEPSACTECGKVRNGHRAQQIEEDDRQHGVAEAQFKDAARECAERKSADCHVRSHPHGEAIDSLLRGLPKCSILALDGTRLGGEICQNKI